MDSAATLKLPSFNPVKISLGKRDFSASDLFFRGDKELSSSRLFPSDIDRAYVFLF